MSCAGTVNKNEKMQYLDTQFLAFICNLVFDRALSQAYWHFHFLFEWINTMKTNKHTWVKSPKAPINNFLIMIAIITYLLPYMLRLPVKTSEPPQTVTQVITNWILPIKTPNQCCRKSHICFYFCSSNMWWWPNSQPEKRWCNKVVNL